VRISSSPRAVHGAVHGAELRGRGDLCWHAVAAAQPLVPRPAMPEDQGSSSRRSSAATASTTRRRPDRAVTVQQRRTSSNARRSTTFPHRLAQLLDCLLRCHKGRRQWQHRPGGHNMPPS
jgi:hypothetical protein